jgi:hypothetical protein
LARPRKPTAALKLSGSLKHNPDRGRARKDEPIPKGKVGPCPETFNEAEAAAWDTLVEKGFWLTDADETLLAVAARAQAYFESVTSYVTIDTKIVGQLITVLSKLGFSPADRSKIKAPGSEEDKETSPFAQFAAKP